MGLNPKRFIYSIRGLPSFIKEYIVFKKYINSSFELRLYPILDDKYQQGGVASGHYFHQDLLVAQMIHKANPIRHVDIGSRVDGFIAHLAVFREVEIIDIREIESKTPNIKFLQANMIDMEEKLYESCESLSCLHALEHFGLGRYGDPVDVDGHLKGFENMYNILKPNGVLYFSVPIGYLRVEFNAHRVFSLEYLLQMFVSKFEIVSFSYVDDAGDLHKKVVLTEQNIKDNCGCDYGCGIFELRKK
jgi:SAM-dependent methyltransferase